MDLHAFLRSRHSIRRFRADPIPSDSIERVLTTATFAASAHNRQPWRFVVLTEASSKSLLADAMAARFRIDLQSDGLPQAEVDSRIETSRTRIASAPVVILLCMDASEMDVYPDSRRGDAERIMAIQSTANSGMALLLAAHAEGLGAAWSCAPLFAPMAVKQALNLPAAWEPQALFFIGLPGEAPGPRARKPLDDVCIRV